MPPAYLIVNADDYAYFDGVSRGILTAAKDGIVTATGILANSDRLEQHAEWLAQVPELDVGVHLNLTEGRPLSEAMRASLGPWQGRFPGKFNLLSAILRRKIPISSVSAEWQAQIDRCKELGLDLRFLNSHEHIHMLPALYRVARQLAEKYGIHHIRHTRGEWFGRHSPGSVARSAALSGLGFITRTRYGRDTPILLGLTESGKLSLAYFQQRIRSLRSGVIYELMCHPGELDTDQKIDPELMAYHDWGSERRLLCNGALRDLLRDNNVSLIGYRHLKISNNGLEVIS